MAAAPRSNHSTAACGGSAAAVLPAPSAALHYQNVPMFLPACSTSCLCVSHPACSAFSLLHMPSESPPCLAHRCLDTTRHLHFASQHHTYVLVTHPSLCVRPCVPMLCVQGAVGRAPQGRYPVPLPLPGPAEDQHDWRRQVGAACPPLSLSLALSPPFTLSGRTPVSVLCCRPHRSQGFAPSLAPRRSLWSARTHLLSHSLSVETHTLPPPPPLFPPAARPACCASFTACRCCRRWWLPATGSITLTACPPLSSAWTCR